MRKWLLINRHESEAWTLMVYLPKGELFLNVIVGMILISLKSSVTVGVSDISGSHFHLSITYTILLEI